MKKKQTFLLSMFLVIATFTLSQTSLSANAALHSQAQPLRRYEPQMRSVEKKLGEDTLSVNISKEISPATEQALVEYFTGHYKLATTDIDIYKAPVADNLYFVLGNIFKEPQSEDSAATNIFLALREQGGTLSEVTKADNESDAAVRATAFFTGQNKLFAIVSLSAPDGSLAGHYAYEYSDNNLKSLGSIPVIDRLGMSGQVWITNNRIESATAEYKNNTYYVTMKGKGSLYQDSGYDNYKKLAPPKSPVTFFYEAKEWRPLNTRRAGRK
jgi:hypothetical protein